MNQTVDSHSSSWCEALCNGPGWLESHLPDCFVTDQDLEGEWGYLNVGRWCHLGLNPANVWPWHDLGAGDHCRRCHSIGRNRTTACWCRRAVVRSVPRGQCLSWIICYVRFERQERWEVIIDTVDTHRAGCEQEDVGKKREHRHLPCSTWVTCHLGLHSSARWVWVLWSSTLARCSTAFPWCANR